MKTIITLITLVVVTVCQSQNFIAKAVYKTSKKANFLTENENKNIDKNLQEKILQKIQEEIFTLPDETTLYTGHGSSTTVAFERENNPFFN